jgi:hypothetical protein
VRLPRSPETAIVLLGILKAGGTYALIDDPDAVTTWPRGVAFSDTPDGDEMRFLAIDMASALGESSQSCANLPIVRRGSDAACVLPDRDGIPLVVVPHETIMALQHQPAAPLARWSGEPGALDLWTALMTGATVTVEAPVLEAAA